MEELPRDFTKMFDYDVFKFDVDLIPQAKVSEPSTPFSSPTLSLSLILSLSLSLFLSLSLLS
jgi:hypothetical protein